MKFRKAPWLIHVHLLVCFSILTYPLHRAEALVNCESCTSEYSLGDLPKSVLISIKLSGAVGRSGLFNVPRGTDLLTLLTSAGGVAANSQNRVVIKRREGKGFILLDYDLDDILHETDEAVPIVMQGDVVMVPHSRPILSENLFRVLALISSVAGLALTGFVLLDRTKSQ